MAGAASVNKLAQLAGPALGGGLIVVLDVHVYFAALLFFLVGAVSAGALNADLRISGREPFGLEMLFGGFRHILRTRAVLGAITIDLVAVLFGGVIGLLPAIATELLNVGPEALGILRAMPAAGGLIVGAMLARFGLPWHAGKSFFVSLVVFAASILVLSVSGNFWLSLALLAIYGGADMISINVRQTLVQTMTPDGLRGRVSSVNSVSINASNQLGDFRAGVMAAAIGVPPAIAVGAAITLGVTLAWFRLFPELRQIERL